MPITGFYAALFALMLIWLSFQVINQRRKNRVPVGDGGVQDLMRAQGAHTNFCQYVPFALLLMACAEAGDAWALAIHGLGAGMVVGRLCHAKGLLGEQKTFTMRITGMQLTFAVLGLGAALNLYLAALRLLAT
ncbi:MAG: MAPEG family protein [Pseudomonadota bacterium]